MFESLSPKRILLVEPPFYRFFGYERWHYPVTLALLADYLRQLGHYVRVYDADRPDAGCSSLSRKQVADNYPRYDAALKDLNHPVWKQVEKALIDFGPEIIGLTSITPKIDSADIVADIGRRLFGSKVTIVLGGSHVQGMRAQDSNYDFGSRYDHIVERIPGLVKRKPAKKLILGWEKYSPANFSCLLTSSGCPNSCTFCCHSFEKSFTYRDRESLRQEIAEIKESFQGKSPVYVMDDCLFSNAAHFKMVCSLLKDAGLRFSAGSRIQALTLEKIDYFSASNGYRLLLGVESGSQRILDRVRKQLKIEEVKRRTAWLNERGIPWSAFFVVGFPFETIDDLKLTEELIYAIRPTFVSLNRFTPYPGTGIYKEYFSAKALAFKELFQLHRHRYVHLDSAMHNYIERMFEDFDVYNNENKPKLQAALSANAS